MGKDIECLFEVGGRTIARDSIHAINIEGSVIRMMVIGYAPKSEIIRGFNIRWQ